MSIKAIGQEFLVNTRTERNQFNPAIAADAEGDFVITWESNIFSNLSQRFSADGTRIGREIEGRLGSANPDIAMDASGNFAIAQTLKVDPFSGTVPDIYLSKFDAEGRTRGGDTINKTTAGIQNYSAIAMQPTGETVVVWESYVVDEFGNGKTSIRAQRLGADGKPIGLEIEVLAPADEELGDPNVAVDGQGNFIVTWAKTHDGIYARRFDAQGKPLEPKEFLVNATHNSSEYHDPVVAIAPNGNFVIAWEPHYGEDGKYYDILARVFQPDGTAIGGDIIINAAGPYDRFNPAIAMDNGGNFVVTWESLEQDGNRTGVYARRFRADGQPLSDELLVNTTTANFQENPDVAMQQNGDFVVTWQSYGQDGAEYGVYAQRFQRAAAVEFKHGEFKVNENGYVIGSEVKLVRSADIDLASQVQIQVTGGSATHGKDYALDTPLTVTFAPGETHKAIVLPILQDHKREDNETIQLQILEGDRAVVGHQSSATVTIVDDDSYHRSGTSNSDPAKLQTLRLGTPRRDRLTGTETDELLIGLRSSDTIRGGDGADSLIGVDPGVRKPGLREIDVFTGEKGRDRFILGDESHVFYNDGKRATVGVQDYALIKDFNRRQDVLQLHGDRSDYRLGSSPSGLPNGRAIYLETGKSDELVAIVQGARFNNTNLQFV